MKRRKLESKRIKQLEQIERYREERLMNELRMLEEEKKMLYHQQRHEVIKEKKRYEISIITYFRREHNQKLKERLEEMRLDRLENELRAMPKKDREKFRRVMKYNDVLNSQSSLKKPQSAEDGTVSDHPNNKEPTHKKTYSQIEPQIFGSEDESN